MPIVPVLYNLWSSYSEYIWISLHGWASHAFITAAQRQLIIYALISNHCASGQNNRCTLPCKSAQRASLISVCIQSRMLFDSVCAAVYGQTVNVHCNI